MDNLTLAERIRTVLSGIDFDDLTQAEKQIVSILDDYDRQLATLAVVQQGLDAAYMNAMELEAQAG